MQASIGVIAVVVSLAAVFISATQADIARVKLRYDLFERRFKVFDAQFNLVRSVIGGPELFEDALKASMYARVQGTFLFGSEVADYIEALNNQAIMIEARSKLLRDPQNWPDKAACAKEALELLQNRGSLANSYPALVAVFAPYMHLDDRMWWERVGCRLSATWAKGLKIFFTAR